MNIKVNLNKLSANQLLDILPCLPLPERKKVAEYVYLKIRLSPQYWAFVAENQRQAQVAVQRNEVLKNQPPKDRYDNPHRHAPFAPERS